MQKKNRGAAVIAENETGENAQEGRLAFITDSEEFRRRIGI
jgi:hypothetical protein